MTRTEWGVGVLLVVFVLSITIMPIGCSFLGARGSNNWKHLQSEWLGLERHISLYGADGTLIREWDTTAKVEDQGGTCYFLDDSGKAVIISGTFIIEEAK